jgi:GAG-pre-integrase domain
MNPTNPESQPTAFLAGKPAKGRYQFNYKSNSTANYAAKNSSSLSSNSSNFQSNGPNNQTTSSPHVLDLIASGKIRIPCQICQKIGHLTKKCYKRYDKDADWRPPPNLNAYHTQTANTFYSPTDCSPDPDASNWLLDSGSNHHVTNNTNNLQSFFSYKGNDRLHVGNNSGLEITHVGSQIFEIGTYKITLNNVLCVPSLSANLISISQLLLDNPTLSINFNSSSCFIKDVHLPKTPPLQISSSNGLYKFKLLPLSSPQTFHSSTSSIDFINKSTSSKVSTSTWHSRLGHPSTSTTLKIINSNSLPCIRN